MFSSGFIPSEIDGSEIVYTPQEWKDFKLPAEYSFLKYLPPVTDQGREPICVPSSLSSWIGWKINSNLRAGDEVDNNIDLLGIYSGGEKYEEVEEIRAAEGMSYKAALKYLIKEGVSTDVGNIKIKYYAMVKSHLQLRSAIFMNGPCFGALPVYNSGLNEFWKKGTGDLEGYHAISIVGYTENGFIIRNSWGKSYGRDGYWEISYLDAQGFYELWTILQ